jgi:hypothetical protein
MFLQIPRHQHGFLPGRGTLTAIGQMLTDTIKFENIYEFDLKACFPSISLPLVKEIMVQRYKIPPYITEFYVGLNHTLPTVKGVMKDVDNKLIVEQQSL